MSGAAPDIVGLGLATLDILVRLREMPTWERPGCPAAIELDGGGPVGTACVAAARLGARVGYIGVAGSDEAAALKMRSFVENGVDVSRVVTRPGPERNIVLVYVHAGSGERVFSILRDPEAIPLQVAELDRDYITAARFLHLDGHPYQASLEAAHWMHQAGKLVSLDCARTGGEPVSPLMAELVRHTDILICGSGFGRSLTGRADLWEAGAELLALGPRIVVQTEGVDGSYTVSAAERFHTPAFAVDVVDTTGAGDVFHGAYLAGLVRGWPLPVVARFAAAAAALKCTRLGGRRGAPRYDEVITFIDLHRLRNRR